jgi:D-glycero-D-manno-heptose 1,7-bisphosphate phosphatase
MTPRYVLLDRDGTILEERSYLREVEGVALIDRAAAGLRRLREMGLGLVVITNQSGIGRGMIEPGELAAIHERMRELLRAEGVELDGLYFCPHRPDEGCACRKPGTGLVEAAAAALGFEPAETVVIGDKPSDLALAEALGVPGILVTTGYGRETLAAAEAEGARPAFVASDLPTAAKIVAGILRADKRRSG